MNFLCVCVRIPKSGSTSLHYLLEAAFAGRQFFYVPHTLNIDGQISRFQELRFLRSRARHLLARYGTPSIVGSSRVDLQACKLEYSIVSPK